MVNTGRQGYCEGEEVNESDGVYNGGELRGVFRGDCLSIGGA